MKKIKRSNQYEIELKITDDNFISPPRDSQRNAVVNRAVKEFAADLDILDKQTKKFVPGATVFGFSTDREQQVMSEQEIMEDWQIPLMKSMSKAIAENGGDILEIGFGRGISAEMIMEYPIDSYTAIECNDDVIDRFYVPFKNKNEKENVSIIHGLWQDKIDDLEKYDGIFFHTYPLNDDEYMQYVNGSITFAEHFFSYAAAHLKKGGSFTYFSNEIDSLSRQHQQLLFNHFSSFNLSIQPLKMPEDVIDTWWADSIAIVKAIK